MDTCREDETICELSCNGEKKAFPINGMQDDVIAKDISIE